jgi:hypothetical protein
VQPDVQVLRRPEMLDRVPGPPDGAVQLTPAAPGGRLVRQVFVLIAHAPIVLVFCQVFQTVSPGLA